MLCYSGNGKLYVRTGSFPVQEQVRTGVMKAANYRECTALPGIETARQPRPMFFFCQPSNRSPKTEMLSQRVGGTLLRLIS